MINLNIPVEETYLATLNMDTEKLVSAMRTEFALNSFRDGKFTLVQGAHFCGMNIYDFIAAASEAEIPIINYLVEDFEKECAQFRQHYTPKQCRSS
ncbi:hypothetical protein FACS1894200_06190 [Spirochaetia bacterium]|nr:hypothetical protein FACS1894200_06190 [Spirochaetia bacterium]